MIDHARVQVRVQHADVAQEAQVAADLDVGRAFRLGHPPRLVRVEQVEGWARIVWGGGFAWVRADRLRQVPSARVVRVVGVAGMTPVRGQISDDWRQDVGLTRNGRWYVEWSRVGEWVEIQYDHRRAWIKAASTEASTLGE